MYTFIYIYIYVERERETERGVLRRSVRCPSRTSRAGSSRSRLTGVPKKVPRSQNTYNLVKRTRRSTHIRLTGVPKKVPKSQNT